MSSDFFGGAQCFIISILFGTERSKKLSAKIISMRGLAGSRAPESIVVFSVESHFLHTCAKKDSIALKRRITVDPFHLKGLFVRWITVDPFQWITVDPYSVKNGSLLIPYK